MSRQAWPTESHCGSIESLAKLALKVSAESHVGLTLQRSPMASSMRSEEVDAA